MLRRVGLITILILSCASRADVVLLSSVRSAVLDELAAELSGHIEVPVRRASPGEALTATDVVVLAGDEAIESWRGPQKSIAIWSRREVIEGRLNHIGSALYTEPPLRRQLGLAQALFPDARVSVLYSDKAPDWLRNEILALPEEAVFQVEMSSEQGLNYALRDAFADSDVLLGVSDPAVYSPATIKNILISAYRQNIPLVGPHQAYIRAGAIATTYSSIPDTAHRLAEMISAPVLPEPGVNPYFSVLFNEQVARSLNISLPENTPELLERINR